MSEPKQFLMEIKKTDQRKSGLDNIYRIVLECEDNLLMDLGKLPPDELVLVTIEPEKHDPRS